MPVFAFSQPPTPEELENAQSKIAELETRGMTVVLHEARSELGNLCYTYFSLAERLQALHDLADLACQDIQPELTP